METKTKKHDIYLKTELMTQHVQKSNKQTEINILFRNKHIFYQKIRNEFTQR